MQPILYEEPHWTHRAVIHAHRASHIVSFQGAALKEPAPREDHDKSLTELIDDDPDAWMFTHSTFPDEGHMVAEGIANGTVIAISDGSYMPDLSQEHATAAWIIECQHTGARCWGVLQVPGKKREVNAYRAETLGGTVMRKAIHFLERRWNLSHGKAICGLDCDGVSDKFAYGSDKISQRRRNTDLLCEGNTIRTRSKIDTPFQRVAGHMDDHFGYNDLTRE